MQSHSLVFTKCTNLDYTKRPYSAKFLSCSFSKALSDRAPRVVETDKADRLSQLGRHLLCVLLGKQTCNVLAVEVVVAAAVFVE